MLVLLVGFGCAWIETIAAHHYHEGEELCFLIESSVGLNDMHWSLKQECSWANGQQCCAGVKSAVDGAIKVLKGAFGKDDGHGDPLKGPALPSFS